MDIKPYIENQKDSFSFQQLLKFCQTGGRNIWKHNYKTEHHACILPAISTEVKEKMFLPSVSLCPTVPFKQPELLLSEDAYLDNAASLSELFHEVTWIDSNFWILQVGLSVNYYGNILQSTFSAGLFSIILAC